jgi:hypothetical protein
LRRAKKLFQSESKSESGTVIPALLHFLYVTSLLPAYTSALAH